MQNNITKQDVFNGLFFNLAMCIPIVLAKQSNLIFAIFSLIVLFCFLLYHYEILKNYKQLLTGIVLFQIAMAVVYFIPKYLGLLIFWIAFYLFLLRNKNEVKSFMKEAFNLKDSK